MTKDTTAHTAILVIHGIGEQNPYETLDSFARGLATHFAERKPVLRAERISHEEWTEVAVHVEFKDAVTPRGLKHLSLFEFYWAPFTEDKVSYWGVIRWLARTAFTPLAYLADNLQALLWQEQEKSGKPPTRRRAVALFLREVLRIAFAYVPLLIIVAVTVSLLYANAPTAVETVRSLVDLLRHDQHLGGLGLVVVCLAVASVLLWFILQELIHWAARSGPSVEKIAENVWLALAVICCVGFFLAGLGLARILAIDLGPYVQLVVRRSTLGVLALVGGLWFLKRIAVGYLGDIAVYVATDQKAASFEAKAAILRQSSTALATLLIDRTRQFDQVVLCGHSLGSVIAYDTVNELLSRVWSTPELGKGAVQALTRSDLENLRGLVTFGSPLDKVYYFYREHVASHQAVRAQILSFLYSLLRARSGRDYGRFTFTYPQPPKIRERPADEPFAFPQLGDAFQWVNVWSRMDPVSGPLRFYRLDDKDRYRRRGPRYLVWGFAHLAYWGDPTFYKIIADRFL